MNIIGQPISSASKALTIDDVPRDPNTKEYNDFRDRAAFVYTTGTFPTISVAVSLGCFASSPHIRTSRLPSTRAQGRSR